LDIVKAAILAGSWPQVKKQYDAVRRATELKHKDHLLLEAKFNAAIGLYHLRENNFLAAARAFLLVTPEIKDGYKEVISGNDVTNYACLCALSHFGRRDLQQVLETDTFRKLLDLEPAWIDIIQSYQNSKYADAFKRLDAMKEDFALDYYMAKNSRKLIQKIRDRALIQYFRPFVSVKLNIMAKSFGMDVSEIEKALAELIGDEKIEARIDSANKVMYARNANQRNVTFQKTLNAGTAYVRNVKSMLMRMSLIHNDLSIKHPKQKEKGGGGPGPRRGGEEKGARGP